MKLSAAHNWIKANACYVKDLPTGYRYYDAQKKLIGYYSSTEEYTIIYDRPSVRAEDPGAIVPLKVSDDPALENDPQVRYVKPEKPKKYVVLNLRHVTDDEGCVIDEMQLKKFLNGVSKFTQEACKDYLVVEIAKVKKLIAETKITLEDVK